jgi:hypothetical protein
MVAGVGLEAGHDLRPTEREGAQHKNVSPAFRLISKLELLKGERNGCGGLQCTEGASLAISL